MLKGKIHQEDVTILSALPLKNRASKCLKKILFKIFFN